MQNIRSQFKYTIDLGVEATKATFKLKKSKKDKVTHILIIVFMFIMASVLVWDIVRNASFVIDLILLIALICVEIINLIMPKIIIHTQKKFLKQINLNEMDYTITEFAKNKCVETYYKDAKIVMQNACDLNKIIGYQINNNYAFVVFNNYACAIFDTNTLNVNIDEFTKTLDDIIAKNKLNKFKSKV